MRLDLERVARREAPARARARGDAGRHLLRLDPHLGRRIAVGLLLVEARIVEELRFGGARVGRLAIARCQQARRRLLERVVGLDELPGSVGIFVPPTRDHAGRGRRGKSLRRLDLGLLAVGEGGVGVGDHHLQRPLRVLEVVADALMLHEAAHEGEVGLPVLHAVIPGRVAARDLLRERDLGCVAEHRLDDVGNRLLLKNLAVARERGKPQARHHLDLPPGEHVVAAHPGKAADIAREPAGRIARVVDPEAHLLPHDRRVAQRLFDAQALQAKDEQCTEAFFPVDRLEQQFVLAERRLDRQRLAVLRIAWWHGSTVFLFSVPISCSYFLAAPTV